MNSVLKWIDSRTGLLGLTAEIQSTNVPRQFRWVHLWGSTLVYTFLLQVLTGFVLWAAYSPSTQTAWESVYYLQYQMTAGGLVRGLHYFVSDAMILLMAIYFISIVISGAYRAPREINFWLVIGLIHLVLAAALTGFLLPWDQQGYYSSEVRTNIMSSAPVVGDQLRTMVQAGANTGHHTLTRTLAVHAGLFPALVVLLFVVHVYCSKKARATADQQQVTSDANTTVAMWPDQALRIAAVCLAITLATLALAAFKGAPLTAPVDPSTTYDPARPEWYFLFLFQFLHFEVINSLGITVGAMVIPGAIVTVIAGMPIIESVLGKWGHRFNVAFLFVMLAIAVGLSVLALYNDSVDDKYQTAVIEAKRDSLRVRELASGPDLIPVGGAQPLMQSDPFTQGPRLFAKHCSSCHRWNGHDGRGNMLTDADGFLKPTAPDLGQFGSRQWMKSLIVDYPNHFQFLKNAEWFVEAKAAEEAGEDIMYPDPDGGEMSDWSGDQESLESDENAQNLKAIVEWLYAETGHQHADAAPVNNELLEQGKAVATEGAWAGGLEGTSCADCHTTLGEAFELVSDDDADGYPSLAQYGSASWLKDFIRHPDAGRHYGEKNRMPAYSEEKLSDHELDMLVRYMTGDFQATEVSEYSDRTADLIREISGSPNATDTNLDGE